MTTVMPQPAAPQESRDANVPPVADAPDEALRRVCPYLLAATGSWRSVQPTRDHRCSATQPAAAPAVTKQRDLCLQPGHTTCATYVAARDLERLAGPVERDGPRALWPAASATVLALEPARGRVSVLPGGRGRTGGQALLVGLMVVAFLVLVIARTTPPAGSVAGGAASADPAGAAASAAPVPSSSVAAATPRPTPSPAPSPTTSPGPTASPESTPRPSAPTVTTYTVKSGDTLSSIALAHGISVRKLKRANDLESNTIRRGQVLVIPAG
jgi:LysM repeat protein